MIKQVAVWIDHKEARIFHLDGDKVDEVTVSASAHDVHHRQHSNGPEGAKEHPNDAKRYFHEVARAMDGAEAILVVGPSTAKLDFIRYVHKNDHAVEQSILGVETVDHPTDGEVVAYAKKYFDTHHHKR